MSTEPSSVSPTSSPVTIENISSTSSPFKNNIPEYLIIQINRIAKEKGYNNYEIQQNTGSKHGDGFMGEMLSIILVGDRSTTHDNEIKQDTTTLIIKLLPKSVARREFFNAIGLFNREVLMYNKILPFLAKLQHEKGLSIDDGFFNYPNCYFAISDSESDQYAIIMDDIRLYGFVLWDKLKPIGTQQVRLLMIALGRFHALSFIVRDQKPNEFKEFRKLTDVLLPTLNTQSMEALMNGSLTKFIKMFNETNSTIATKLSNSKQIWKDGFYQNLKDNVAEPFAVIGHGDCWNNNMMFRNNNEGNVGKVCLFDWQVSRLGSVALDLIYYLFSSTTKELRDNHLDELLRLYHNELSATIRKCGSNPYNLFSWENLQNELRKFGNYGVLVAPMLLEIMVNKPENITEMNSFAEHIKSNPNINMTKFDDEAEKEFKQRVQDVYDDAEKYGWIDK